MDQVARDSLRLARKVRLEKIDQKATTLYDKLNPNWAVKINVSKAECINRVLEHSRPNLCLTRVVRGKAKYGAQQGS